MRYPIAQIEAAEQAAVRRLEHAYEELHGDLPDDADCECLSAFCGCYTCIVREILDAALGVLEPE